jgi:hypothetical protein
MDAQIIKAAAKGREAAERREQERRKHAIVLILRHLLDFGYLSSYQQLEQESHVSLAKVSVCRVLLPAVGMRSLWYFAGKVPMGGGV